MTAEGLIQTVLYVHCTLIYSLSVHSVSFKSLHFSARDENEVISTVKRSIGFEDLYYRDFAGVGSRELMTNPGRDGDVTNSSSCADVTEVPVALRYSEVIQPAGINSLYTKYTEAYGIPVLGSASVPDTALSRACYVLRFLLADRHDLRHAYFKSYGRVLVLGRQERISDLPDYSILLRNSWTGSTRSLGAIPLAPATTGAEENVLCYIDQEPRELDDTLLKSLAIGILNIAAMRVDPGIRRDLERIYTHAMASGWWSNTNAARGPESYLGEGVQSFFNANAYSFPANGFHNDINTRTKLAGYDSALFNFIRRFFPCANNYIKRCSSRGNEGQVTVPMDCPQSGWHANRRRRLLY